MKEIVWSVVLTLLSLNTAHSAHYNPDDPIHVKVNEAITEAVEKLKETIEINSAYLSNGITQKLDGKVLHQRSTRSNVLFRPIFRLIPASTEKKYTDQVNNTDTTEGQLNLFTFEDPEAKEIDYLSQISLTAAKKLMENEGMTIDELKSSPEWTMEWKTAFRQYCIQQKYQITECDKKAKYRTMDGRCNNLKHPHWGKSNIPQERLMAAQYDDGLGSPMNITSDGHQRPNARHISNIVFRSEKAPQHHHKHSQMVMAWGQFIDHDFTKTPASTGENGSSIKCCGLSGPRREECFEIDIPEDDPHFKNQTCMNFVRSSPASSADCNLGVREQLNSVTSYIDASTVYGSTDAEAKGLRSMTGGRLKVLEGDMPPKWFDTKCTIKNPHLETYCMLAGDGRVNVIPNLSALHILFIREHNRIVDKLSKLNPLWNDERLYQEGRKIVAAYMQHFTYDEYLPRVLNGAYMSRYKLHVYPGARNRDYNQERNPGIFNVFAVAAFRFGHSQISDHQSLANEDGSINETFPIESLYHDPEMLQENHCKQNCPLIAKWLITDTCTKADQIFDKGVRDLLFLDKHGHSLDLPALNIQRGRDHGIPSYTEWRKRLGLSEVRTFNPKDPFGLKHHTVEAAQLLEKAYAGRVKDIDLYAGAMSETHLPGADVGPVFSKLIAMQFRQLKIGDRFWYENGQKRIGFTKEQIRSIKKVKLAKIVCENMNLIKIQEDVMVKPHISTNKLQLCSDLDDIDFALWSGQKYENHINA